MFTDTYTKGKANEYLSYARPRSFVISHDAPIFWLVVAAAAACCGLAGQACGQGVNLTTLTMQNGSTLWVSNT